MKNGLLPVQVDAATLKRVMAIIEANPTEQFGVELAQQVLVFPNGITVRFPIDTFSKKILLEGIDELGYILSHEAAIAAHEARAAQA